MLLTITNQTDERVLLRFNSGATHHLAPRAALEVEPVEVKGNDRIHSLADRRIVALDSGESADGADASGEGEARNRRPKREK